MAHPQPRPGPLRLYDDTHRYSDRPTALASAGATVEQLLREEDASRWSPHGSPTILSDHELNGDHTAAYTKRSVLARVREKAKKWRQTLIKKKHAEDGNTIPSWGVSLADEEEEDPEYLGAPMYESEKAPELYRETARQHPRANPVIPENHLLPTSTNCAVEPEKGSLKILTEKLGPAYATMSDATLAIASKLHSLTVSTPDASAPAPSYPEVHASASLSPAARGTASLAQAKPAQVTEQNVGIATSVVDNKAAAPSTVAPATVDHSSGMSQMWDKGVSVKEYIVNKFEPGEDERALSQVISQAISPRKIPGDPGVVDIVKEAVNSLLRKEEAHPPRIYHSAENSSTNIPVSTNAHEVEEETQSHGRILQAN